MGWNLGHGGRGKCCVPWRRRRLLLPYPDALVKVADDQFAFTTAESGGGGEGMFKRMAAVESGLSDMKGMLQQLLRSRGQTEDVGEPDLAPGARPKAGAARAKVRATNPTSGTGLNALDPGTVGAARQAGISEAALEEMARRIGNKKSKAEELPLPEPVEENLSFVPDEFGDPDGVLVDDLKDPMQQALIQLTKIVGNLSKQQAKQRQDLDSLLDQAQTASSSSEPSLGTTRRSNGAALRILTKAFEEFQGDLSGHRDANAQGFRPEAESGTTRTT